MAISSRDMWVILRARDEASRVLRSFSGNMRAMDRDAAAAARAQTARGQALVTIGAAIATGGIVALSVLNDMTVAAAEYHQEAAKAMTQTDGVVTSVGELKDIGREIARVIPAAFDQMQGGLYDIFSSMDVTLPEAKMLLTEFSRAAVGGQVDLQVAARGTIAVLNAYKMPAKDVNRVNDIMFQLVRKGVGTYEEFATAIGRAIPASVRANQSFETLGGMMAFLTRNGLSAAMAATSSARALEAMANPRTVTRIEEMGVTMKDASGEFLPLVDILGQMNSKFKDMTTPERAAALQNLFKGSGGTIQARRFFDVVFTNFDEFERRVEDMKNSAGALDEAYEIMFDTPQAQMQLMTNKYEAMRTEIGDKLIPIKLKLVEAITAILDGWNNLSPQAQTLISYSAALAAGLAILVGAIVAVSGASLILSARFVGVSASAGVARTGVGRFAQSLGGTALGAAGLVAAMVMGVSALDDALRKDVTIGANEARQAVRKFAQGGKNDINVFFKEWGTAIPSLQQGLSKINDLDSAFDRLFNRSRLDTFGETMNGIFITTEFDEIVGKFKEIDTVLADMISGGNVDDAEAAFEQIAEAARRQGVSMEKLTSLFPEYKDAMLSVDAEQSTLNEMTERYGHILGDTTMSLDEATKALQDWIDMAADADASFIDFADGIKLLGERNEQFAKDAAAATDDAEDSWEDFIGDFPFTVDGYLAEMERMVEAQNNWEANMLVLSGRVSQGLLDELISMGEEGAPLVAELVNASNDELARMEAIFAEKSEEATQAWATTMSDPQTIAIMQAAAQQLGTATALEIATKLRDGTATVDEIMKQYGIIVESTNPAFQANPTVLQQKIKEAQAELARLAMMKPTPEILAKKTELERVIRDAKADLNTIQNKTVTITANFRQGTGSNLIPRAVASGGPVFGPGTSTSDSIPAMLSNGEFVLRAAAVRKYGMGKLWAMNSLAYAGGGSVGQKAPVDFAFTRDGFDGYYGPEKVVTFESGAFQITTQEIDPLYHSAQLGQQLAGRMS